MSKLKDCDKLSNEIKGASNMSDSFDPLYEYRKWWDMQGIESEGKDGWPLSFCFEPKNISDFAEYWNS